MPQFEIDEYQDFWENLQIVLEHTNVTFKQGTTLKKEAKLLEEWLIKNNLLGTNESEEPIDAKKEED